MYFEEYKSILYSDTLVPDIFITEYMPSMDSDFVKVYIYCLFLSKHNKQISNDELANILMLDKEKIKSALLYLESVGIISRKDTRIVFSDLKEKEIKKMYRLKATSTPEEAAFSSERNKLRNKTISAINNAFFQGLMPPTWYTDIDSWFDKYGFEEDVMYALFQHCFDKRCLNKNYIMKVADNWYSKGIKNSFDLDKYFIEYEKVNNIKFNIVKKLKLKRMLTEYEEAYVEKWVNEFGYDFDIIEIALKRTTSTPNPSFEYINSIISDWHSKQLKSKDEIQAYEKEYHKNKKSASSKNKISANGGIPQHGNFEQRQYDKEYFENLYEDV